MSQPDPGPEPETFSWDETLEMGTSREPEVSRKLQQILTQAKIRNVSFADDPETQLNGIDAVMARDNVTWDTKTQRHDHYRTGNLPFETISVVEANKPGWFYTSDADIIVWVYETKSESDATLMPRGYFLLHDENIVEWFNERLSEFRKFTSKTTSSNSEWTTLGRLVPIEDIPDSHICEFNPRGIVEAENDDNSQSRLGDFVFS